MATSPFGVQHQDAGPERTPTAVACMYHTHLVNQEEAKKFWAQVARGGLEYQDDAPSTVLDSWLKAAAAKETKSSRSKLKPGDFYYGSLYAWNAYRQDINIKAIKKWDGKGSSWPKIVE